MQYDNYMQVSFTFGLKFIIPILNHACIHQRGTFILAKLMFISILSIKCIGFDLGSAVIDAVVIFASSL